VKRPPTLMPTLYTCVYGIERHGYLRVGSSTKKLTAKVCIMFVTAAVVVMLFNELLSAS
jgi:hypothetical protein